MFFCGRPGRHPLTPVVYEQDGNHRFCGEDLQRRWGTWIGWGVKDCPRSGSREVNVWTRVPQAKGGFVWSVTEIHVGPFCGEAVEVCRIT